MAKEEKSILKEAILDAEKIQAALKENTKEILRSVSREEIDEIVKESLEEAEYVEEDVVTEDEDEMEDDSMEDEAGDDEVEDETGEEEGGEEESYEDEESDMDAEEPMSAEEPMGDEVEVEPIGDAGMSDDEEVMDMTGASDEDVISVYKKLSGEDEIEVVGDEITLNVSEPGEYVIKTGSELPSEEPEMGMDAGMDAEMDVDAEIGMDADSEMGMDAMGAEPEMADGDYDDEGEDDDVMYEIALDENLLDALSEETKIGATAKGKPRTATSDVEKSMTGEIATGDIDGQKAPEGNENDDNWAGDNLEGGFPEDEATKGDGHAEYVMTEGNDPEDDIDDEGDVVPDMWNESEEVNEDEVVTEEEIEEGEEIEENLMGRNGKGPKNVGASMEGRNKGAFNESANKYNNLLTEAKKLKVENEEFRKSLKTFRGMLAETVVFNSNLTYVTKLFMEHAITKDEKKTILSRFDGEVKTIKESKRLYKTITNELKGRTPIKESVNGKIIKENTSGVSKNLNEATAYVDQSTQRIMNLIERVETRND